MGNISLVKFITSSLIEIRLLLLLLLLVYDAKR